MPGNVAVLIIHGMGSQEEDFAGPTIEEINDRISDKGKDPAKIAWQPVFWADLVEPRQRKFMRDIIRHKDNEIDFVKLRRFVISALGDASAYQNIRGKKTSTYQLIHKLIRNQVKELYRDKLGSQPCPLFVMAHSLGGHIMSNYIWDAQKKPLASLSDFENMKHLAGMITFGCNIPLFSFSHDELEPIAFPGNKLTADEKSKAKWLNFYDPDDVLGYPQRQIGPKYSFIKDKHINSGGLFTSWNPLSHNGYWTDNDVTKPAANLMARFL
jgi:hypothetical protein